jgi:uncharacterized membrane protein
LDAKTRFLLDLFQSFPPELAVMGIAALPIAELRLAIPVAVGVYGMSPAMAFGLACLGNLVPIPIILLLFQSAHKHLAHVWPLEPLFVRIHKKIEGHRGKFERWGPPALISFVAIPLPVTGAWTGSAAATVFEVPFWPSLGMLTIGVAGAGCIVTALTMAGKLAVHG